MRGLAIFAAAFAPMLAACGRNPDESASGACSGDGVIVQEAWARAAPVGQPTSAAYLTLCNGAAQDDALVGATMDGVAAVELHISAVSAKGMASMTPAERIALPAGETVALAPGGAHLMLIKIAQGISANAPPAIRLEFEHAPPQEVRLEVRAPGDERSN